MIAQTREQVSWEESLEILSKLISLPSKLTPHFMFNIPDTIFLRGKKLGIEKWYYSDFNGNVRRKTPSLLNHAEVLKHFTNSTLTDPELKYYQKNMISELDRYNIYIYIYRTSIYIG